MSQKLSVCVMLMIYAWLGNSEYPILVGEFAPHTRWHWAFARGSLITRSLIVLFWHIMRCYKRSNHLIEEDFQSWPPLWMYDTCSQHPCQLFTFSLGPFHPFDTQLPNLTPIMGHEECLGHDAGPTQAIDLFVGNHSNLNNTSSGHWATAHMNLPFVTIVTIYIHHRRSQATFVLFVCSVTIVPSLVKLKDRVND